MGKILPLPGFGIHACKGSIPAVVDGDISTIPRSFSIERTVYGPEEGTVTVLAYFQAGNYTERKRYTYYLRRRDDIWNIVDYVVVNLGTE
jgi:hypothetical protein